MAIPHGRIFNSDQAVGVLIQCVEPINFNVIDNQSVNLLFVLLVPDEQCKKHFKMLLLIAQTLGDRKLCKKMRMVYSGQELYEVITGE